MNSTEGDVPPPAVAVMPTSRKPYLIRAMHEWICDNDLTPHLVVDAEIEGVVVPRDRVADGKIILNIGGNATEALQLGNELISFATRFSGTIHSVQVPCDAVLGIYARETGEGMIFTEDSGDGGDDDKSGKRPDNGAHKGPDKPGKEPSGPRRPTLKVVK